MLILCATELIHEINSTHISKLRRYFFFKTIEEVTISYLCSIILSPYSGKRFVTFLVFLIFQDPNETLLLLLYPSIYKYLPVSTMNKKSSNNCGRTNGASLADISEQVQFSRANHYLRVGEWSSRQLVPFESITTHLYVTVFLGNLRSGIFGGGLDPRIFWT